MKNKISLLLMALCLGANSLYAQHENDHWVFGNNKWKFDATHYLGYIHTINSPYLRYASSVISDKNTGNLLFYSDGYKIYDKNGAVMNNGDNLFGVNNTAFNTFGNPSDQSSIIVPLPNSNSIYYVFYINGDKKVDDQENLSDTTSYNYGLRYAIVDMSLNGGLGAVTSKNNILFSNSPTNALTSTVGSNGNSYWIVTANNGNFLSYKLTPGGLNTNPVSSPAPNYGNFFKISPNSKKLATRINKGNNKGIYLSDFDNATGIFSNQTNIVPPSSGGQFLEPSDFTNSAEFSGNSDFLYFTNSDKCLCDYPAATSTVYSYQISNSTFNYVYGHQGGHNLSMQRAANGKIYMIQNYQTAYNASGIRDVVLGWTSGNSYHSYSWVIMDNPNIVNSSFNNIGSQIPNAKNGYAFPQLVPHLDNTNKCPNIEVIDYPIANSTNFQAAQSIIASSVINNGLVVNYKAGQNVLLLPGFSSIATAGSLFKAYIAPCDGIEAFAKNNDTSSANYSNEKTLTVPSQLKVYPNPASDYINISSGNEKLISWELYDMSGKLILKGNEKQIDVRSIVKGNYLLKINSERNQTSKMVIIK